MHSLRAASNAYSDISQEIIERQTRHPTLSLGAESWLDYSHGSMNVSTTSMHGNPTHSTSDSVYHANKSGPASDLSYTHHSPHFPLPSQYDYVYSPGSQYQVRGSTRGQVGSQS
jgi:hypothetical protein